MNTRFALRLPQHQSRLVSLAVHYHLVRPGSEIDPETLGEYRHGLAELAPEIDAQLDAADSVIEVNPLQMVLLGTALSSVISELKMYSIFDTMSAGSSRPRSTASGFDDRLRALFPAVTGDAAYASQLAEDMMMLRRQLPIPRAREMMEEQREAARQAKAAGKRWWRFWSR